MSVFKFENWKRGSAVLDEALAAAVGELPAPARIAKAQPIVRATTVDPAWHGRVGGRDLCAATRQWATLAHAGMSWVEALTVISQQLGEKPLGKVFAQVVRQVNEGASLAEALRPYESIFTPVYVSMVLAGESCGKLDVILLRLAETLENRARLAGRIKAAMAYPLVMTAVAVGVVTFLLTYVVPGISQIFTEMKQQLPLPTTILIGTGAFLRQYIWLILLSLVGLVVVVRMYAHRPTGRQRVDRIKLRLPFFGGMILKLQIARLTRILGVLLASGVSILEALRIARGVVGNTEIARGVDQITKVVGHGEGISRAMESTGLFPAIVIHTVRAHESGGRIEEGLLLAAETYEQELDLALSTMTSILEPVIMLVMGVVVGFIVLAILLPIFDLNRMI